MRSVAFAEMTVAEKWEVRVQLLEERGLLIDPPTLFGHMMPDKVTFIDPDGSGRWFQTYEQFAYGEGPVPG